MLEFFKKKRIAWRCVNCDKGEVVIYRFGKPRPPDWVNWSEGRYLHETWQPRVDKVTGADFGDWKFCGPTRTSTKFPKSKLEQMVDNLLRKGGSSK